VYFETFSYEKAMSLIDHVEEVRRVSQMLDVCIGALHDRWLEQAMGHEVMIPDSVDTLLDQRNSLRDIIDIVEVDAHQAIAPPAPFRDVQPVFAPLRDVEMVFAPFRDVQPVIAPPIHPRRANGPPIPMNQGVIVLSDDDGDEDDGRYDRGGDEQNNQAVPPVQNRVRTEEEVRRLVNEEIQALLSDDADGRAENNTDCPICMDPCNGDEPVSYWSACYHLIHDRCLRDLTEGVS
jgi:hypothetical protein